MPGIYVARATWVVAAVGGLLAAGGPALAGGFGVREQSADFMGSAFAGAAAGGDLSSMYWNPAATASKPGCNSTSSYTLAFGQASESANGGLAVTGAPGIPALSPTSTEVGSTVLIPASYASCQLSDRLYVGIALNSPFGFVTKPDNANWAGSPIAMTSKVFTVDINPTLAYKLSPELTIGVGVQMEFFSITINRASFGSLLGPLSGARAYGADSWGFGATAGVLWQPARTTSIGLGYRSAVTEDASGDYSRGPGAISGAPVTTTATSSVTLPDEVTLSARHALSANLAVLGTIAWQDWSRVQNVAATSAGCPGGVCEVLNLNYRDGWFYAVGAEYAVNPALTLRTGIAYETSPIQDSTRDILLPDSNRVELAVGASYKLSDRMTVDFAYSHLFFQDANYCIASAALNGGTSHCNAATPPSAVLLTGKADVSADLIAVGAKYKF
jgi:long-chain fatty acid transport protein